MNNVDVNGPHQTGPDGEPEYQSLKSDIEKIFDDITIARKEYLEKTNSNLP